MTAAPAFFGLTDLLERYPVLAAALRGLDRAAASEAPLLLVGEPGTGRTTLARAVHAASQRRTSVAVEVDLGTVPTALFESEIFGHRAGAFTGAEDREGRVERARGGTLIFDHVEETPLEVQPKLLRMLSEQEFEPLGGSTEQVDVRFVALGDERLRERVERGLFREDLYFRLEVLSFRVPPLRQRVDELPTIVASLCDDLRRRAELPPVTVAPESLEWMATYRWPGNLRELRNRLERSLVMSGGGQQVAVPPPSDVVGGRPRSLRDVEVDEIRKALAYTRGHQGRAAELLGISRKALWEKRRRYGIP